MRISIPFFLKGPSVLIPMTMLLLCGCSRQFTVWSSPSMWYNGTELPDETKPDVFYLISTEVLHAEDSLGNTLMRATLSESERFYMDKENAHAARMFGDSLNLVSPYYHQFTMEAGQIQQEDFLDVFDAVTDEVCEAFDYYSSHINPDRDFILAGFSQGAMLVLEILKRMKPKVHSRMIAAYMLGYRLSEEDLQYRYVIPADDAYGRGEVISFNTVMSADAAWPFVSGGAATCINPLNWHTDSTPAALNYRGDRATVSVDTLLNVLVAEGLDREKYCDPVFSKYYPEGSLHHWDFLFYEEQIRRNALLRASNGD